MKNSIRLQLIFLIMISVISCKQKEQNLEEGQINVEDRLVVELSLRMEKDDVLEIYYRNKDETYNSENKFTREIKGSENYQTEIFVMDQFVFPSHIRIDLGSNPDQAPVIIDNLAFKYNKAEHRFTIDELKKYFQANAYLEFDFNRLTGKGRRIDGKYDPYLSSFDISYFVNKLILY